MRAELHYAKVCQVEEKVRLVLVKIEPCDVPEFVRTTLWEEMEDLSKYDRELERIVNAIYRQHQKPPVSPKPAFVRPDVLTIGELTRIDSILFERACRIAIEQDNPDISSGERLVSELGAQEISVAQIIETQDALEGRHYIELHRVIARRTLSTLPLQH